MIAARLDVPVVPVRLEGLDRILHQSWKFPQRGRARVTFGAPMSLKGNDYAAMAARVEAAVNAWISRLDRRPTLRSVLSAVSRRFRPTLRRLSVAVFADHVRCGTIFD